MGSGTSLVTAAAGPVLIMVNLFSFLFWVRSFFFSFPLQNPFGHFTDFVCLYFQTTKSFFVFVQFFPASKLKLALEKYYHNQLFPFPWSHIKLLVLSRRSLLKHNDI